MRPTVPSKRKVIRSMNSTGIVRKIDELGRIVLPQELRTKLDLGAKDGVEFYWHDNFLMLKKHEPACTFCGSADGIIQYEGKNICKACRGKTANFKEE